MKSNRRKEEIFQRAEKYDIAGSLFLCEINI